MERKKVIYLVVIAVISAALIASLLTYYFTTKSIERGELYLKGQSYEDLMKYFELEKVKSMIDEYYIRDVQAEELLNGSLSGSGATPRLICSESVKMSPTTALAVGKEPAPAP